MQELFNGLKPFTMPILVASGLILLILVSKVIEKKRTNKQHS